MRQFYSVIGAQARGHCSGYGYYHWCSFAWNDHFVSSAVTGLMSIGGTHKLLHIFVETHFAIVLPKFVLYGIICIGTVVLCAALVFAQDGMFTDVTNVTGVDSSLFWYKLPVVLVCYGFDPCMITSLIYLLEIVVCIWKMHAWYGYYSMLLAWTLIIFSRTMQHCFFPRNEGVAFISQILSIDIAAIRNI